MRQITRNTAKSERERIAAALEEDIVFGWLKPRERLVEQDIMDRLEARRHVVRTALEILENKGLVERGATYRNARPMSCISSGNCFIARRRNRRGCR